MVSRLVCWIGASSRGAPGGAVSVVARKKEGKKERRKERKKDGGATLDSRAARRWMQLVTTTDTL